MARKILKCEGDFFRIGTGLSTEVVLKSFETLRLVEAPVEQDEMLGVGDKLVIDRLEGACELPNGL